MSISTGKSSDDLSGKDCKIESFLGDIEFLEAEFFHECWVIDLMRMKGALSLQHGVNTDGSKKRARAGAGAGAGQPAFKYPQILLKSPNFQLPETSLMVAVVGRLGATVYFG